MDKFFFVVGFSISIFILGAIIVAGVTSLFKFFKIPKANKEIDANISILEITQNLARYKSPNGKETTRSRKGFDKNYTCKK